MKIAMSPAASALFRGLLDRTSVARDRILLTEVRSVDWQSLTFIGERHEIQLRVAGPGSETVVECLCDGIEEHEFELPGLIVVEIAVRGRPIREPDGATLLTIEALTIEE
jgi:hypothetical protein